MDKLWAPWRAQYITAKKQKGCIFCLAFKAGKNKYVIARNRFAFAMLNTFPYNNGHIMIAPLRHTAEISSLKKEEILGMFSLLSETKRLLKEVLNAQGYNIGINISDIAGAGVKGHLHMHIVPRWKGDTNFMPVLYGTKIVSQSLGELYKRLKDAKSKTDKRIRR
ncbi:MAG: HIT domain-containing protein [Candidatus Omnitrophota bacterium]